jgi:hypothetical protein
VTFTAHVTATSGREAAGQVRFFEGATQLGQGNLNASGDATFSGDLPVGDHPITRCAGANVRGSGTRNQTVNTVPTFRRPRRTIFILYARGHAALGKAVAACSERRRRTDESS